jgi:hypothetical protein
MPYINALVAHVILIFEKSSIRILVLKNLIAHRERNQMTSIMISLTLGFVIFLNIVGTIPFARDMHNAVQDMGRESIIIDRYNLPISQLESLLKKHAYALESWGVQTHPAYNKFDVLAFSQRQARSFARPEIENAKISDLARRKQERTGIVGITPNYANSIESEFYRETMSSAPKSWWDTSKRDSSVSEDLYSSRGTQSAIVSEMSRKALQLDSQDPDSSFLLETTSDLSCIICNFCFR